MSDHDQQREQREQREQRDDRPDAGRVGDLLRVGGAPEPGPGEHVWDAIRAEVAGASSSGAATVGASRVGTTSVGTSPVGTTSELSVRRARQERRRTLAEERHRRPSRWPLLAAAAVGALVAWLGIQLVGVGSEDDGVVVASAALAPLPDSGAAAAGDAEVVTVDGEQRLRVHLDETLDAGDGYLEVWLLRPDVSGMVTVGVLSGDTADLALPAGVDLADYPVVDISLEQVDGDPTHGGRSLVRGELDQASASGGRADGIH